ncbi:MAG: thiamine phosphate synthase [Gammaproteobacteria bacterium]|nr:thiamine phosphate synthase [Gammaproteobacteria bacterium]
MPSLTPPPPIKGLYTITDPNLTSPENMGHAVESALKGGAKLVQYRDKNSPFDVQVALAKQIKTLCTHYRAQFIVNDDLALAQAVQADGIHIGKNDCDLAAARKALGESAIIGVTCYNDLSRALAMQAAGANYVAFGRFFPSKTKPNAPQAELETLREAKACLHIPVVAIGGIHFDNASTLLETGVDSLAVIQGVFAQPDIEMAARKLSQLF